MGNIFRRLPFPVSFAEKIYNVYWSKYGKFRQRWGLHIEIHAADHCNLNCAYCSHYSPISKPKFVDIVQYENDLKRLAELGADKVVQIRLLGGEPLLNDKITLLAAIARNNFPKCRIQIVTNGTLLLKQDKEFWRECGKNNVEIFVSYYPVNLDYEAVRAAAKEYMVKLSFGKTGGEVKREMLKYELDLDGKQYYKESFKKCDAANSCTTLREGKIYQCPESAYIGIFNEYFNLNLAVSEKDYIDIYKAGSMNEILEFLCNPAPFCRYCTNQGTASEWRTSKREISEWAKDA
ncbi:MAG: radical SAM protein [Spirochaetaceae bacterium]|nr:radical SAM protein [Spirochaetaceae bacterium]